MSKDLITTSPSADRDAPKRASRRPNAEFLAHLVATSAQVPQTRARRRAGPKEATAAYDALGHWPMPSGRAVSRSL